jgi:hypothetical protein
LCYDTKTYVTRDADFPTLPLHLYVHKQTYTFHSTSQRSSNRCSLPKSTPIFFNDDRCKTHTFPSTSQRSPSLLHLQPTPQTGMCACLPRGQASCMAANGVRVRRGGGERMVSAAVRRQPITVTNKIPRNGNGERNTCSSMTVSHQIPERPVAVSCHHHAITRPVSPCEYV